MTPSGGVTDQPAAPDKIFVAGFGWMTPGVCTPSWCSEGTGAKCSGMPGRCRKAAAERLKRKKERTGEEANAMRPARTPSRLLGERACTDQGTPPPIEA